MEGKKVRIRDADGKEYDCLMTQAKSAPAETALKYETGEILGYTVRRDTVENSTRLAKAKVYELKGQKLIYLLDYCGNFQAGKFFPGQMVQFRVDADKDRIAVRHDGNQEYSCQLEGMHLIQSGLGTPSAARCW